MADKPELDEHSGVTTTGHEWDGIKELNTPLPRWWLMILYGCIVWAIIFTILMPSWPGLPGMGYWHGIIHRSARATVAEDIKTLEASRATDEKLLLKTPLNQVEANPELQAFALEAGEAAFGENCVACHGAGGAGSTGFPALNDDVWLWGGKLADIKQTITYGIRNDNDNARYSQMPSFGKDGILDKEQVADVVEYVLSLSGQEHDAAKAGKGAGIFQEQCSVCHGDDGKGNRMQGAPNLTDIKWLYGGTRADITYTVTNARFGVMPAWEDRLKPYTIDALAVYVHSLGGGE